MLHARVEIGGRHIRRRGDPGHVPAPGERIAQREVLADLRGRARRARRSVEDRDRARRIAGQRGGEAQVGGGDILGMGVQRRARRGPVARRDLRQCEVERGLAVARHQVDDIGKGVARRGEAPRLQIALAEQHAIARVARCLRYRAFGIGHRGRVPRRQCARGLFGVAVRRLGGTRRRAVARLGEMIAGRGAADHRAAEHERGQAERQDETRCHRINPQCFATLVRCGRVMAESLRATIARRAYRPRAPRRAARRGRRSADPVRIDR